MDLAEIKHEISRLSVAERHELALQLEVLQELENPARLDELTRAQGEAEQGIGSIDRDELLARLRAARHLVQ